MPGLFGWLGSQQAFLNWTSLACRLAQEQVKEPRCRVFPNATLSNSVQAAKNGPTVTTPKTAHLSPTIPVLASTLPPSCAHSGQNDYSYNGNKGTLTDLHHGARFPRRTHHNWRHLPRRSPQPPPSPASASRRAAAAAAPSGAAWSASVVAWPAEAEASGWQRLPRVSLSN